LCSGGSSTRSSSGLLLLSVLQSRYVLPKILRR
jgi:hypothetical protein